MNVKKNLIITCCTKSMANIIILLLFSTILSSCNTTKYFRNIFKDYISVQDAIDKKIEIDASENPAYRLLITRDLKKKRVEIEDIIVKDVISSSNIDYNFCVIVSVSTSKLFVE